MLSRYTGDGIAVAEGEEHKAQRRKLMPAFKHQHIKGLYPTFWAKAGEALRAMTTSCESGNTDVVDIYEWAGRCSLDVVGATGMGVEFGAILDANNPLVQSYAQIARFSWQDTVLIALGKFFSASVARRLPFRRNQEVDDALRQIRTACWNAIQAKKTVLKQQQTNPDICSVALESRLFSDEDLVEQLMGFLFAGHHTMAQTLTAAIYKLCVYPNMQKRLREEVRQRLPSALGAGDICSSDIDDMPFLHGFCKEVFRVYGGGEVTRVSAYDTEVQGYKIPKGTAVTLASVGTNSDPTLWGDDASEFRPERWMAAAGDSSADIARKRESGGATSSYAFLTFVHGPQSCIAARFAQAEFACLLAAWVGCLEFTPCDETLKNGKLTKEVLKTGLQVRIRVLEE